MYLDNQRKTIERVIPRNLEGMSADFAVLEAIQSELERDRSENPLLSTLVQDLATQAIMTWGDKTSPSVDRYLMELLNIYTNLAEIIEHERYGLDVEVAVEPNPAEEPSKASVDLHSHPLATNWIFEEVVKSWPGTEGDGSDHNGE